MIVLNKKSQKYIAILGLTLALGPWIAVPYGQAQDLDLSKYLGLDDNVDAEEPTEDGLADPNFTEGNDSPVVLETTAQENTLLDDNLLSDALPVVGETRLSIEDTGLDMSEIDSVRQPVRGANVVRQSSEELAEEIRQEAFDAAITGLFPMRPNEIKEVLRQYDTTTRAVEEPINGIPTPIVSVETISLDPGVVPMILKTATGHITTVNILDATGAPWPIQDISWAGDFEVIEPEEGGNIIRVTPMGIAAYGNMSIRLLELGTPVTIMLSTSKDVVQYRVDARIAEFGPQSTPQLIDGGSNLIAGNDFIMSVLDGTPPQGILKLQVGGVDGRTTAYRHNNMTYVRTPLTLLSPGWQQSVSSADGMNVYALNETPVLLLSDKGRFTRASLKTEKDAF